MPTGGRFAKKTRAEVDIMLTEEMPTRPERSAAERSAAERSAVVVEDPSWSPGPPFRPEYLHNGSGTADELLHDYDQWQARIARLEAERAAGANNQPMIDDLNRRMRRLTGELVTQVRTERNVDYDDPDWDPVTASARHPTADGPSLVEIIDDYDRWVLRDQVTSVGQNRVENQAKLDTQMSHLVHDLAHRTRRISGR